MTEPETDDPVRDGFAPRGVDLRDFSIIRRGGLWHIFFLDFRLNQHSRTWGQGVSFGHAVTENLTDWQVLEPALFIDPGQWDGRAIWAPYVMEHRGEFYMFYTGLDRDLLQSIGLAASEDLVTFERHPANPVLVPEAFDWCLWSRGGLANCRDPHVLKLDDGFCLYYTAVCKTGEVCVAAAESQSLLNWQDRGPVISIFPHTLDTSPLCIESACVHPFGNRYLLSYSYDRGIWVNISESHLSFEPERSVCVLGGHLAMEKVADLDGGSGVWLVAFFNQVSKERPSRLFFGMLDLRAPKPRVELIHSRQQMAFIVNSRGIQ